MWVAAVIGAISLIVLWLIDSEPLAQQVLIICIYVLILGAIGMGKD